MIDSKQYNDYERAGLLSGTHPTMSYSCWHCGFPVPISTMNKEFYEISQYPASEKHSRNKRTITFHAECFFMIAGDQYMFEKSR